jgi:rod shape-determining protein MreC
MVSTGPSPKRSRDRWWWIAGRLLVVLLCLAAITLLILNRTAPDAANAIRGQALDAAAPMLDAAGAPVRAGEAGVNWISSYFGARDRAIKAEREVLHLKALDETNRALKAENARLRGLISISEPTTRSIRVARVVGASAGSSLYSAILTGGAGQGFRRGQPVRDVEGLVGRIIEAGRLSSRVLLITDTASRVPVKIERTGHSAMAGGVNGPFMHLLYLDPDAELKIGDRVVTSGQGGLFPPNIPVGTVAALGNGEPLLRPTARLAGLDYVLIMQPYVEPVLIPPPPPPSPQADVDAARAAAAPNPSPPVTP